MRFHTDHYFHIGATHYTSGKPCQDYAMSVAALNSAYAVVSDGCSTGGNTDIGARIVTLATLRALERWHGDRNYIQGAQLESMKSAQEVLGLRADDMLATCVYALVDQDGVQICIQGDGVAAIKFRDGEMDMFRIDWNRNAPLYPAYHFTVGSRALISGIHGGDEHSAFMTLTDCMYSVPEIQHEKKIPFSEAQHGYTLDLKPSELEEIEFIAVFSDGVTQVENVDWRDAVKDFMAFKSTTGEFAKRRMIRGIKDFQKLGKGPLDDIAYAVIRVEQETIEGTHV